MAVKSRFLLRLGDQSKQVGDEGNLPRDVSFFRHLHLSFPKHMHHLISLEGLPCCFKRKESQPWFDHPFDAPDGLAQSGC